MYKTITIRLEEIPRVQELLAQGWVIKNHDLIVVHDESVLPSVWRDRIQILLEKEENLG